jgi:hypothetical protein
MLGLLVKWKRSAKRQREVGFSLRAQVGSAAQERIERSAARKGWRRVYRRIHSTEPA